MYNPAKLLPTIWEEYQVAVADSIGDESQHKNVLHIEQDVDCEVQIVIIQLLEICIRSIQNSKWLRTNY